MKINDLWSIIKEDDGVDNIEFRGDWSKTSKRKYGWDDKDIGILTSPVGVQRIKNLWSKCPYNFDIYLVKSKDAKEHVEVGEVPLDYIKDKLKIEDFDHNDENITIFYTNNTGSEKVPATPWTLAHRFGHAVRLDKSQRQTHGINFYYQYMKDDIDKFFVETIKDVYGRDLSRLDKYSPERRRIEKRFAETIGTFKSARKNNLRDIGEFQNELIAQYIITGDIKFNKQLPDIIPTRYAWGKPIGLYNQYREDTPENQEAKEDIEWQINAFENTIKYDMELLFDSSIGKIFVM